MAKSIRVSDVSHLSLKRWAVEHGCTVGSLVDGYASRLGSPAPLPPVPDTRVAVLRARAFTGAFSKSSQVGKS